MNRQTKSQNSIILSIILFCFTLTNIVHCLKNDSKLKQTNLIELKNSNKKYTCGQSTMAKEPIKPEELHDNMLKHELLQMKSKHETKLKQSNLIESKNSNKKHTCGHSLMAKVAIKPLELYGNISQHEFLQIRSKQEWAPIRIHVDYSILDSQTDKVSAEKIKVVKEVMERSVKVFQKLLRVKPLITPVKPGSEALKEIPFSEDVKKLSICRYWII